MEKWFSRDNGDGVLDGILKKDLMSSFIVIWILKDCHFLSASYPHFEGGCDFVAHKKKI